MKEKEQQRLERDENIRLIEDLIKSNRLIKDRISIFKKYGFEVIEATTMSPAKGYLPLARPTMKVYYNGKVLPKNLSSKYWYQFSGYIRQIDFTSIHYYTTAYFVRVPQTKSELRVMKLKTIFEV